MKQILIAATLVLGLNASVVAEDLDQLLAKIEADITAQRLTKPAGNNALERIDAFRKQAPFDYRITPLVFKFGESYVALANKSINNRRYPQAQQFLNVAWQVSPLAPGLEAAQEKLDRATGGKSVAKTKAKGPSKEELAKQKKLAAAAAAEKKRLDEQRKKKAAADKQAKVDAETTQAQAQQLLRQEWGREYDTNINKAKSLANANLAPEVLELQLSDGSRLGDNVDVIKGFAKIANMLSEDKILSTESENMDKSEDIQTEIDQIMNDKNGPYWNKSHPNHDKVVQQVYTMREMLDGSK